MTKTNKQEGADRRRSARMAILDTFSLFAVVPSKGPHRLRLNDISDVGVGFDLDIEEESGLETFQVKPGDRLEIQLYVNQSLYLPLTVEIRRVTQRGEIRGLGAEFLSRGSQGYLALIAFLDMLDALGEGARVASG